jgi:hypothetical protein
MSTLEEELQKMDLEKAAGGEKTEETETETETDEEIALIKDAEVIDSAKKESFEIIREAIEKNKIIKNPNELFIEDHEIGIVYDPKEISEDKLRDLVRSSGRSDKNIKEWIEYLTDANREIKAKYEEYEALISKATPKDLGAAAVKESGNKTNQQGKNSEAENEKGKVLWTKERFYKNFGLGGKDMIGKNRYSENIQDGFIKIKGFDEGKSLVLVEFGDNLGKKISKREAKIKIDDLDRMFDKYSLSEEKFLNKQKEIRKEKAKQRSEKKEKNAEGEKMPEINEDEVLKIAEQIRQKRIKGEPPYEWTRIDQILTENKIARETSEADEFMDNWDKEEAARIIKEKNNPKKADDKNFEELFEKEHRDVNKTFEDRKKDLEEFKKKFGSKYEIKKDYYNKRDKTSFYIFDYQDGVVYLKKPENDKVGKIALKPVSEEDFDEFMKDYVLSDNEKENSESKRKEASEEFSKNEMESIDVYTRDAGKMIEFIKSIDYVKEYGYEETDVKDITAVQIRRFWKLFKEEMSEEKKFSSDEQSEKAFEKIKKTLEK